MIKILHLYTYINITCGISKTIFQIANYYRDEYCQFIICCGGDGIKRFEDRSHLIYQTKRPPNAFYFIYNLYFIYKLCVKNKVNIIHSHHRYWDLIAYLVSLFNKVKTVTSVQSKVRGKKLLSYKASKLIAASGVIRDHLIAVFKIRESRIEVINNCVDEGLLNPHVNSISFKQNDIINLGFVGRFNKEKGVDVLLQAYRMLVNERNNYSLTLVGDGEEKSNLESYIKQHNLLVKFVKPVEDVFNYMQMFDIIILPSRVDPFPLVMLEAGIMKKPFIGSNVDGIAELITHEVDGLLVEPEEPIKLKNAILRLADDIELCNKIANSLYLKVSENYTLDKIIPKYKILYKSLINND